MSEVTHDTTLQKTPPQVPRWLVRTIWIVHRAAYSITGGRLGLRPSTSTQWGMLRHNTFHAYKGWQNMWSSICSTWRIAKKLYLCNRRRFICTQPFSIGSNIT